MNFLKANSLRPCDSALKLLRRGWRLALAADEYLRRIRLRVDQDAHERHVHLVVALQAEPDARGRIRIEPVRR